MTQTELAEMLNYSDKAVSKWERAESVPDISVLKHIADIFGVTVDYLITSDHSEDEDAIDGENIGKMLAEKRLRKRTMITGMSVILVWLVAAVIFVPIDIVTQNATAHWLSFVFAVPVSTIVWLVFNSMWFNKRRNFLIISLMMWSFIVAIHLSVLMFGVNIWQMYLVGIPGQIIIVLWSIIGKKN